MIAPSVTDWAWFGRQKLEDVARCGTQRSEPATWLKEAYAWVYSRLDDQRRSSLPKPIAEPRGPSPGMIPVLAACSSGTGCLGFVSVSYASVACPGRADDSRRAALEAATAVGDTFRGLDHGLGQPFVELIVQDSGGHSVGLSALVAAVINLLSLTPREDFAATGCLDATQVLTPVVPATLPVKIEVAKHWGYKRLLVVEGQENIPEECGIEIVEIPRSLVYAILAIIHEVAVAPDGFSLASFLAVFDRKAVWSGPCDQDLECTLKATQEFISPQSPGLARHVAHDIRSRALLHAGRTGEAATERANADGLRPSALEFTTGWLGDYLRWYQVAHHAVLALDQGRWEHGEPEHQFLDRTLDRLLGAISDKQAGREELLAALFLSNTRARRLDFLGRWHRDRSLVCRAWEDVTRFESMWSGLFEYCRSIGLKGSDLRRQHNYCLDVLASYWHLEGNVPESWSTVARTFWPHTASAFDESLGPFDPAYLLRWKVIFEPPVSVDFVDYIIREAGETFDRTKGQYPFFLVFELILRYRLGSETQQREAARRVAQSALFSPELESRSILTVLAVRASMLLRQFGHAHAELVAPDRETRLSWLVSSLMEHPDSAVDRCPY